jgi:hypothetical protein
VEASSNTSTLALRVVGGDKKTVPGDITGTWPSRFGESRV